MKALGNMTDDFLDFINRQMREEVAERYFSERRLLEVQIEEVGEKAEELKMGIAGTGNRLARLGHCIPSEMHRELARVIKIPEDSPWRRYLLNELSPDLRPIPEKGFRTKTRFREIFLESYRRLFKWMQKYSESYLQFEEQVRAVNLNIKSFQNNFDLTAILGFFRSMDSISGERSDLLGEGYMTEDLPVLLPRR